ncbi:LysR family transcriptional regulator [Ottowia sp. VDI28]|uniref:LysR family transcriptional regulator n=1 Tax=Ottowia sp. VDI28 TaxID=3133968 RepID=UPI003C2B0053
MSTIHIERLDLNLLVVLQAVFQEGSMTRASERLHVTQPAISHSLRRLRAALGDQLFVRHGSAIVPTPFTRQVMGPVNAALTSLQSTLAGARGYDPGSMPRVFRLGIRDSLETIALPRLYERLLLASPRSRLHCLPLDRARLADELATGALDCALDTPVRVRDGLMQERLPGADQLCVVARAGHPAVRGEGITLQEYLDHPHVAVSSRRSGLTIEDAALERAGLHRDVTVRVQSHAAARDLATHQDLLLTLPVRLMEGGALYKTLKRYALPFDVPPIEYRLYWHQHLEDDPALRWFRGLISRAWSV